MRRSEHQKGTHLICILAPRSRYALPAIGRLWPSGDYGDGHDGDDDGDGDYGDGSLQCDVGVAGKRGPLQRPHGVRGDGNEPKTQTKMQMSQKHRARNSRNGN